MKPQIEKSRSVIANAVKQSWFLDCRAHDASRLGLAMTRFIAAILILTFTATSIPSFRDSPLRGQSLLAPRSRFQSSEIGPSDPTKRLPPPKPAKPLDVSGLDTKFDRNAAQPAEIKLNSAFGKYQILGELGRGGMGRVYRGWDEALQRPVAIKIISGEAAKDREFVERFRREAQAQARLHHSNIVQIYEVGEIGGIHFISMEYVPGKTLAAIIDKKDMGPRRSLEIVEAVAGALGYAHRQGIIHRDIKPGNILVDMDEDGHIKHIKIADFGLAKDVIGGERLTQTGMTLGTPSYMSPEQARGERDSIDHRSDIYSLGAMLYEMVTWHLPFEGEPYDVIVKVGSAEKPVAPGNIDPAIPGDVETIILKAMEKDPKDRYQSADEFADDIYRYLNGEPIKAKRIGPLGKFVRLVKRNRKAVIIGAVVIGLLVPPLAYVVHENFEEQKDLAIKAKKKAAEEEAKRLAAEKAKVEAQQAKAEQARLQGLREKAGELLRRARNEITNVRDANEAIYREGLEKAIAFCREAIGIDSKFDEPYLEMADLKQRLGNYQGALNDYAKAREINPNNTAAYYYAAKIRMFTPGFTDPEAARALIEGVPSEDADDEHITLGRAWLKYIYVIENPNRRVSDDEKRQALGEIRGLCEGIREKADLNKEYKDLLAHTYWKLGMLEEAAGVFTELIGLEQRSPTWHQRRAGVYTALGRYKDAKDDLDKASELGGGGEYYFNLAQLYAAAYADTRLPEGKRQECLEEAIKSFDKAPKNKEVFREKAKLLIEAKRYQEAEAAITQAIGSNGGQNDRDLYTLRLFIYYQMLGPAALFDSRVVADCEQYLLLIPLGELREFEGLIRNPTPEAVQRYGEWIEGDNGKRILAMMLPPVAESTYQKARRFSQAGDLIQAERYLLHALEETTFALELLPEQLSGEEDGLKRDLIERRIREAKALQPKILKGLSKVLKSPVVSNVAANSSAANAGLKKGDAILKVNDKPVNTKKEFDEKVRQAKEGNSPIRLRIRRDGRILENEIDVRPSTQDEEVGIEVSMAERAGGSTGERAPEAGIAVDSLDERRIIERASLGGGFERIIYGPRIKEDTLGAPGMRLMALSDVGAKWEEVKALHRKLAKAIAKGRSKEKQERIYKEVVQAQDELKAIEQALEEDMPASLDDERMRDINEMRLALITARRRHGDKAERAMRRALMRLLGERVEALGDSQTSESDGGGSVVVAVKDGRAFAAAAVGKGNYRSLGLSGSPDGQLGYDGLMWEYRRRARAKETADLIREGIAEKIENAPPVRRGSILLKAAVFGIFAVLAMLFLPACVALIAPEAPQPVPPEPEPGLSSDLSQQPDAPIVAAPHPVQAQPQAIPFEEKFKRQEEWQGGDSPVFAVGERIAAQFIVIEQLTKDGDIDTTKICLRVEMGDPRYADLFIVTVTPEEFDRYQRLKGLILDGVVVITGEGRYEVSNMFRYPVRVERLEPTLDMGDNVIIEGRITDIQVVETWEGSGEPKTIKVTINTNDGRAIEVFTYPGLEFEDSAALENLRGKKPEVGDVVRVKGWVGKESAPVFHAGSGLSTYLLTPSPERKKAYDKLRREVELLFGELQACLRSYPNYSDAYKEARECISELMKKELTRTEKKSLKAIAASMPEGERPIPAWDRYYADEVNKGYETDIDQMTHEEFYQFAKERLGRLFRDMPQTGEKKFDLNYIYNVMEEIGMPLDKREELISLAIETRLSYFHAPENRDVSHSGENFKDDYMVDASFSELASMRTPSAAQRLINFAGRVLERETIDTPRRGSFSSEVIGPLSDMFWYSQDNPAALEVFQENYDKLVEWERHLAAVQIQRPDAHRQGVVLNGREFEEVSHRYSYEIRSLRNIINALNPQLGEFRQGNFHEVLLMRIQALAGRNPFFAKTVEAVRTKGYRFVLYDPDDETIPPEIKVMMDGSVGALTSKRLRIIYFDLDAMQRVADMLTVNSRTFLEGTIANETVHMDSDLGYTPLTTQEVASEIEKMKTATDFLPSEVAVHAIIKEEILSQVVEDIILKQHDDTSYRMDESELQSPDGAYAGRLYQLKVAFAEIVLMRIYEFDKTGITEEDLRLVTDRLAGYLNSGEIERSLIDALRRYGLLKEAKKVGYRYDQRDSKPLLAISPFMIAVMLLGVRLKLRKVSDLIKDLESPNPDVREKAARLIGKMRGKAIEALPALTYSLVNDPRKAVRRNVVWAIGRMGVDARGAVSVLIYALKDKDPSVRRKAVIAIGRVVGKEPSPAIPALARVVMEDSDPDVRELAQKVLDRTRFRRRDATPEAVPVRIDAGSRDAVSCAL